MTYNLFYTGKNGDDPRNATIIGEDIVPVFICLDTIEEESYGMRSRTLVARNNDNRPFASLNWSPGNHLGSIVFNGPRTDPMPMSYLVNVVNAVSRGFVHNSRHYEWRRTIAPPFVYTLVDVSVPTGHKLATYEPFITDTPVGPTHGLLQYMFLNDSLLVISIIALCLNRWIDIHGG